MHRRRRAVCRQTVFQCVHKKLHEKSPAKAGSAGKASALRMASRPSGLRVRPLVPGPMGMTTQRAPAHRPIQLTRPCRQTAESWSLPWGNHRAGNLVQR